MEDDNDQQQQNPYILMADFSKIPRNSISVAKDRQRNSLNDQRMDDDDDVVIDEKPLYKRSDSKVRFAKDDDDDDGDLLTKQLQKLQQQQSTSSSGGYVNTGFEPETPQTPSSLKDSFKSGGNSRKSVLFENETDIIFEETLEQETVGEETEPWDSFKSIPIQDEDSSLGSGWTKFMLKLLKLASHGVSLILVLALGTATKLSFHLMAGMTRVNKTTRICNGAATRDSDDETSDDGKLHLDPNKHYFSQLEFGSPERLAWVWMLYFVLISPDVLLFIRSVHNCLFKRHSWPNIYYTLMIWLSSTSEVIGISMFAYLILPSLDIVIGLMVTNSLFLIPSIAHLIRTIRNPSNRIFKYIHIGCVFVQATSLIAWPTLIYLNNRYTPNETRDNYFVSDDTAMAWLIPFAAILISFGYWENFIGETPPTKISNKFLSFLYQIKQNSTMGKYSIYLIVSVWKCALYLLCAMIIQGGLRVQDRPESWSWKQAMSEGMGAMFDHFSEAFSAHSVQIITEKNYIQDPITIPAESGIPVMIGLLLIVSSFFCYEIVNFVCKICIQPLGFAVPISMVLPLSVSMADMLSEMSIQDPCWFPDQSPIFQYISFNCHYNLFDYHFVVHYLIYAIWILTFISQMLVTYHIWISSRERLAPTDRLFMLPLYHTAFIDQSLMLNRRLDDTWWKEIRKLEDKKRQNDEYSDTRIFACATVWHETADELLQMLKSIIRVDRDQCCRRLAVEGFGVEKQKIDYFEFETHLFVDDAFVYGPMYRENNFDCEINEYVQTMIQVLDEAAQNVHQRYMKIRPPQIFVTPYGGRIEWTLPGQTKLIAHLKDKARIRHRKRWSQVMYMYYLLGYKIFQQESDPEKRAALTRNTFLLALDGDINFQPEAVLLLVDLMKNDSNLGAACGRVHPIGSGPMAWYQKFEYAISHWLQKATEHVFGCVLCSPGCFSLFRAAALCDTNIMNRYTTKPTEARHYVQYDQGEDRWLCTLMLQQGWRVEYSAASDSFTHCPEGFDEFYIQRRRWTPSTIANIIDLLQSYKYTVKVNDSISSLYMLYQAGLMLGTILSPGTIFLMLVGAMNTSFGLKNEYSFYINFIPVLVFVLVCFFTKTKIQILVAQIFSTFYAMLMLAVLVSTGIEIYDNSILSPSVIFFVGMMAIFVLAAVIHPQEITCLFPVFIYMLAIPSMYLLLTLYSIINLNIVTWGTRENPAAKQQQQQQQQQQKSDGFISEIGRYLNQRTQNDSRKWNVSCLCCTSSPSEQNQEELVLLRDIKDSVGRVGYDIQEIKSTGRQPRNRRASAFFGQPESVPLMAEPSSEPGEHQDGDFNEEAPQSPSDFGSEALATFQLRYPRWVNDPNLKGATVSSIDEQEKNFWVPFIEKYLKPLDEDKHHQEKVKNELIDLRNKSFFALGIINIIFVLFVYLMQLHKDIFSFDILVSRKQNGTQLVIIDDEPQERPFYVEKVVKMDPVGLFLIVFFGIILFLQVLGMLLHRLGTLTHLLAFTDVNFFSVNSNTIKEEKQLDKNALPIIRYMMDQKSNTGNDSYIYFDMEKLFFELCERIELPEKAHEMVRGMKALRNVSSKKNLSEALYRRASVVSTRRRSSIFPSGRTGNRSSMFVSGSGQDEPGNRHIPVRKSLSDIHHHHHQQPADFRSSILMPPKLSLVDEEENVDEENGNDFEVKIDSNNDQPSSSWL